MSPKKRAEIKNIYSLLDDMCKDKKQSKALLKLCIDTISVQPGENMLLAAAKGITQFLHADHTFIAEYVKTTNVIKPVISLHTDKKIKDEEFAAEQIILKKQVEDLAIITCPDNAQIAYPKFELLERYGIEAFLGWPLKGAYNQIIGFLFCMYCQPLEKGGKLDDTKVFVHPFTNYISSTLERLQAENELIKVSGAVSDLFSTVKEKVDALHDSLRKIETSYR